MSCTLCESLQPHAPITKRHERLQQVGLTERVRKEGKIKAAWITYYICEICETKWRHVDDTTNANAGWSVQKHPGHIRRPDYPYRANILMRRS